ncbi:hypothetical protein HN014_02635 [Aquimarina sp. TRL1]|uniref:hypothetical protein n=1 Tax=Aquimarina sp. (strain TRL1) TaxID=2736252 RepID=UPI00158BF3F5|nr:hypothetical protein [Aquimarina sp. TRL1]QKX03847.1 hypothetical protein HN014_02635 [Aquimarina sp. TRL1]
MNVISSIIATLSPEEKRNFISHLKQKNKRNDTRNLALFKLLDTTERLKNPDIILYGKPAKGAYHALCKRLHDRLIDFIAAKSFDKESSEEMETLKLLLASRIFFEQKKYKTGLKTINKGLLKAQQHDQYSILNEMYYTLIQHAHHLPDVLLSDIINDYTKNQQLLQQEERLNIFYATVQNILQTREKDATQAIIDSLAQFGFSADALSYRSLYKIMEISNIAANATMQHHVMLPFIEKVYQQISPQKETRLKHLFYHIQILYYVANSYFRNRNFTGSFTYLDSMHEKMLLQQKKFYKRFYPQYILLRGLTLNYTDKPLDAIQTLECIDERKYKDQLVYLLDIKLTLVVCYFQQYELKKALRIFQEFYHSDHWYIEKTGILWVLKKSLIEILLHIELANIELVSSRLTSFKKKYLPYLKKHQEHHILEFVKLITFIHMHPEKIPSEAFSTMVNASFSLEDTGQIDIFVMSFYAWLRSKIDHRSIYETTLQLIATRKNTI